MDMNTTEISEKVREGLMSNNTLNEFQDLSQDTLDGLYAYAYDFYDKGKLEEAELFFKFLCIYDFYNADYLKGYGAVCQLKKEYQRACDLYGISFSVSNESDYSPIYLMGQCLLCMKKLELSRDCFETVINNSEDEDLKDKADKYLELLKDLTTDKLLVEANDE